ncbi:apolipoprotein C-I-like [Carettochelys insculpta]|uniref:apolipoprotein C-I-like n=1 Tax=Carettochelys insculpta TaxID=44489 RepID=UPI003EBD1C9E
MQPALPIALVLLALAALADPAQADVMEPTLTQKFENFQTRLQDFADSIANRTKAAFQELQDGDFAETARNWFSDKFVELKEKFDEMFAKDGSA